MDTTYRIVVTYKYRVQAFNRLEGVVQNTKEFLGPSFDVVYTTRSEADMAAFNLSMSGIPAVTYSTYPVRVPCRIWD